MPQPRTLHKYSWHRATPLAAALIGLAVTGSVVLAPAATPAPPVSASAPARPAAGLGLFSDVQYLTGAALRSSLARQRAAGATWVRFQLIWPQVEAARGRYEWRQLDAVVGAIVAAGMLPLPVAGDTPAWAFAGGRYPRGCTAANVCGPNSWFGYRSFARFAATATARYGGQIRAIEIWNEANNPAFWQPRPHAARYTALLRATYTAVKRVSPHVIVISSGLAPGSDRQGGGWLSPMTYLRAVYAAGGRRSFDAVGWHPYTWPADPRTSGAGQGWYQMVNQARAAMVAYGDRKKQIWATEFGMPTCSASVRCVTPRYQAVQLDHSLRLWFSYPWAGPLIAYGPFDTCSDKGNPECFFGLMTAAGRPKPALAVFTRYARARPWR